MIDCHSHILPGIDDGASSMEVSLEMARLCVAAGVTHIVTTPHGSSENMETIIPARDAALLSLQERLREENIPLKLIPGLEYYADGHSADMKKVPLAARMGYAQPERSPLLIELPMSMDVHFAENIFFNAQLAGLHVVLAHPCRYGSIKANKALFMRLLERGIYLQFNAGCLIDRLFFNGLAKTVSDIIKAYPDRIVLGSDCHDAKIRAPGLKCARKHVISALGEDIWNKITCSNPARLLGIGDAI